MFARTLRVIAPRLENTRSFAVTGRHSKNVAGKKNKLDAQKTKLFAKLGTRIVMVYRAILLHFLHIYSFVGSKGRRVRSHIKSRISQGIKRCSFCEITSR
jgi:hypothetical protein